MLRFIGHKHVVFLLFLLNFPTPHAFVEEVDQTPGAPSMVQQHACLYGDLEFRPIKNGYDVYTAGTCCRRQVGTFTLKGTSGNHILEDFETTITSDVGILNLRAAIEQRIQHWNKEKR